jgi:hypothetical protein
MCAWLSMPTTDRRREQGLFARLLYGTGMRIPVSTTMICTHVLKVSGRGVRSPVDALVPA